MPWRRTRTACRSRSRAARRELPAGGNGFQDRRRTGNEEPLGQSRSDVRPLVQLAALTLDQQRSARGVADDRFHVQAIADDPAAWEAAMQPNTRLLFLETPSNPLTKANSNPG